MIMSLLARWIAPQAAAAILVGAAALSIVGVLLGIRRSGRLAERAEQAVKRSEVQRAQLEAAADRPGDRAALSERMRAGRF